MNDPVARWVSREFGAHSRIRQRVHSPIVVGFSATTVERIDLTVTLSTGEHVARSLFYKTANPREVTALEAVTTIDAPALPKLLDNGALADGTPWVLMPCYPGHSGGDDNALPDAVVAALARVHANFATAPGLSGIPTLDPHWFREQCGYAVDRLDPHGPVGLQRARQLAADLAGDDLLLDTVDRLPRTLVHGDIHANNVVTDRTSVKLVDWGGAAFGPAMIDVANIAPLDSPQIPLYVSEWTAATGRAPDLAELARSHHWATVAVQVKYLPFAARYLGPAAVATMTGRARAARERLAAA